MNFGVHDCNRCGAIMREFMQTNSGRIVYKCPDCGKRQFADGSHIPLDVQLHELAGQNVPAPERQA